MVSQTHKAHRKSAAYRESYKAYKSAANELEEFKLRRLHNELFFDGKYDEGHAWRMLRLSVDSDPVCRMHQRRLQNQLGLERSNKVIPLDLLMSGRILRALRR